MIPTLHFPWRAEAQRRRPHSAFASKSRRPSVQTSDLRPPSAIASAKGDLTSLLSRTWISARFFLLSAFFSTCLTASPQTEVGTSPSNPQPPSVSFASANKLYEQGKYKEAVAAYQALREHGQTSVALFYNLGNARFKAGEIGQAMAAYLEASHLAPRDPDIRANLQFARKQVQGPTLPANAVHAWLSRLTLNEWSALSAFMLWLVFAQLIAMQLWPAAKSALRPWTLANTALALLLMAGAALAFSLEKTGSYGVIVAAKVQVHSSPFEGSDKTFELQDGSEVRVLDQKENWLQITTDPRRTGWVQKQNVASLAMRP